MGEKMLLQIISDIIKLMKKNIYIISGIIILVVIFGCMLSNLNAIKKLELLTYDIRTHLATDNIYFGKNFSKADTNIVIVALDDYSKKELMENSSEDLGPWPWHRDMWSKVVDFIEQGKPKAVLFDMVFENLNENSWNDRRFAQELRKYNNIVLGTYLTDPKIKNNAFAKNIYINPNNDLPTSQPLNVTVNSKKLDNDITYYMNAPVNDIYTQYNTIGVLNKVLDSDNNVRKDQPIFKLVKNDNAYYMPSLAFAGFLKYMGEGENIVIKKKKLFYKDRVIPLNSNGTVTLSWHKCEKGYTYLPVSKILLNKGALDELQPKFFTDKLVIIGKTSTNGPVDLSSTVNPSYTSNEATAVALDNFINDSIPGNKLTRKFIYEIPKPLQVLITLLICALVAFVSWVSRRALNGLLYSFLLMFLYVLFAFWLFLNPALRMLIPVVMPLYYLAMTSGIIFAYRFYKEINKKAYIMNVFGKFASPKIISNMLKYPEEIKLKSNKKRITILFCDIKDFSDLCEKYSPEKLINNLNDLIKEIAGITFENRGIIDKFLGNSIMAYWENSNSNDSEFLAVKTALEIKKRIDELKVTNAKENKILFDVKIGINTGDAVLGLTGADKFMNYTSFGHTVDVTSRLETICSTCKRDVLISDSTYQAVKDKIVVLEVGKMPIKGKEEYMEVYEPIGLAEEK